MGKKAPAPPPAPDPVAAANVQGQYNLETARQNASFNRVNQITPFGSLTYSNPRDTWETQQRGNFQAALDRGEGVGQPWADGGQLNNTWLNTHLRETNPFQDNWTATQTLSPSEQRQLDLSNQTSELYGRAAVSQLGRAGESLSSPFNPNLPAFTGEVANRTGDVQRNLGLTDLWQGTLGLADVSQGGVSLGQRADFTGIGDPNQSRDAVEAALNARLAPRLEQDRAALETRLANQGITLGSEAWRTAMDDQARAVNDARLGVTAQAGQEQSRMFGLGFQQAGFGNDARLQEAGFNNDARFRETGFNNDARLQAVGFNNDAIAAANASYNGNRSAEAAFRNGATGQVANMDLALGQFGNAARRQSFEEQLALRNQPINEASALLSGDMIQQPTWANVPQVNVANTPYLEALQLNQQAQQNQFNANNQRYLANLQGQYQLAGAAVGAGGAAAGGGFRFGR